MESETEAIRYEMKMEASRNSLPEVQSWVRLNAAGFRTAYPPRQVNSLYFDTLGLDAYNDHLEGVPERRKLRFRWYGPDLSRAQGHFELKCKRERAGWKMAAPVAGWIDFEKTGWTQALNGLADGLQGENRAAFLEMLKVSRPIILNSYQREYYVSADGRLRLTLDYDMRAYDQWLTAKPNIRFRLPQLDQMLIEFKCSVGDSGMLADVMSSFPLRSHQHSKYVSAIDAILER